MKIESYQAVVKIPHEVEYQNPIKFSAGDRVVVGRGDEEWPGWIWTTIESGDHGWAPESYLEISGNSGLALHDYEATELATQPGDSVSVKYELAGWAWASNQSGVAGWIPLNSIQKTGGSL